VPSRHQGSVLRRAAGAALSAFILAGVLLPGTALAGPGTPPTPVNDVITTTEGTPVSGNVLTNDINGGTGTLTVVGQGALSASVGTLTIAANGAYTFTPAGNWFGTATTTYDVANDKHTRTGTITITVTNVQDAPDANDDTVTVNEDENGNVTSQLLANDTDADNDALTVIAVSNATGGDVTLSSGVVRFAGPANVCGNGVGGFDYTISDGQGGTDTAHATVDITCVNDDPVAVGDDASGTEDTNVMVDASTLLANDTDIDSGSLSVTGEGNPSGGTVSLDSGTITFTPAADLCGDDAATFEYTVSDGDGGTATGIVTIDLTCVNEQPVAGDDTLTGTEDTDVTATSGELTANDTDVDGDELSVTGVSGATGGTVSLDSGTVTFTPDANACGTAEGGFDYDIADGNGGIDTGHVTVDVTCVNDLPTTVDDDASGVEDQDVTIDAADLAADDSDLESGTVTVTGVDNAVGGSVSLDSGTITFTPTANLCGTDVASFDYTVEDGDGGTATGTVTIDLDCVNDLPVASDDDATVVEDTPTALTEDLLANDEDVEGPLSVTGVSNATGGDVVLEGGVVTFTPSADLCGDDAGGFDYELSDGDATDSGHVTVDITCVNDAPQAADDDASGTEDTDVTIDAADLAADDTDVDSIGLTVTGVGNASGGTVSLDSGTITFTPTANLCGTDVASFDYTVEDPDGAGDTGTVTIDLVCVNDLPVANDDTASVNANSAAADHDVLANDTDVEGPLSIESATVSPAQGTASVVGTKVRFTPATNFSGEAGVTYVITDGEATASATLTITVGGDVAGPVVTAAKVAFGTGRIDSTAPLKITWSATDVSGVATYQVQVSVAGGPFKTIYSGNGTTVTKSYAFRKTLVFRVRAKDNVGNWSGWKTSAKRKIASYQNSSPKVAYKGTWHKVASPASSGEGYIYTTTKGDKARLTFTGLSVLYVSPKTPTSGKVKVYVDGKLLGRYDLRNASTKVGRIITRKSWSTKGTHTIRLVSDTSGKRVTFDAFIVLK
jgi:hypothetical protein